jgi:RNA polymerase-binding transcription factor DksA
MDPEKVRHYRERLEKRAASLTRSVHAGLRASDEPLVGTDIGDAGDEANRLNARDDATRRTQADAEHLMEVDEARVRLTRGVYGICEDCDEPIDPDRLELIPEARRCVSCQEKHEHEREAQHPSGQI